MTQSIKPIIKAACCLSNNQIDKGYQFEALHEYTDAQGHALYWRIRLKHPATGDKWIRPMYLDSQQGYTLGEPKFQYGKPLYNLLSLYEHPQAIVIICEGEWCVDKLKALGITATTSGSSTSAAAANWQPLARRSVILWPDNDEAGQMFAAEVSKQLKKIGCTIQILDVAALDLPPKGDVVDWLQKHPKSTFEDIAKLPVFIDNHHNVNEQETRNEKITQASLLIDFVVMQAELFHDSNRQVYAQDLTTHETRRLDSRAFKDWLVAGFYKTTGKSPRDSSIREALDTLSGLARHQGICHEINIRVAVHEGKYYLDLAEPGKSRAICIQNGDWLIINRPPVRFLRPEALQPLPEPVRGGDISLLWKLVNIPDNAELLVIAWLIESLRPDTPFPVLELIGEQGSAKSTTQTFLRHLIDPNTCNLRAAPKTTEDIFVGAGINWLISYENISYLSALTQDALCILSTGGGFAKRKLYSDADESVIVVKRPVVLNGISAAITAQDLIDRTLSIETPVITSRDEMTHLWQIYKAEHANILGSLLTIFSQVLTILPSIQLPQRDCSRLIEFTRLGMAVAQVMGKSGTDFLEEFNSIRQEAIARTIDASPVASALIDWFEKRKRHTVHAPINQLFAQIEHFKPQNSDSWPRSAKGFADALRRAAPALRQLGISCRSLGKMGSYVSWEIKAKEN